MLIANQLIQNKQSFLAVADKKQIAATTIAAGMFNPLVFRRITKSWMVDELLPEMYTTFRQLEERLKAKLIYPHPIVKLISQEEYPQWVKKEKDTDVGKYIQKLERENHIEGIHPFYASATIAHSGYMDLQTLLTKFHQEIAHQNSLTYDHFEHKDVSIHKNHILWKGTPFKNIIFCEGAFAINNPLFTEVNYKLTKGDVLTLDMEDIELHHIINKMAFLLEKKKGEFLCGSTYNWSGLDFSLHPKDLNYLKEKISAILHKPFKIKSHKTAIRPTVSDRRPVLGTHAKYNNVHYFNGLGTKGVMLGPYFAKQMIAYLHKEKELYPEVAINRFR